MNTLDQAVSDAASTLTGNESEEITPQASSTPSEGSAPTEPSDQGEGDKQEDWKFTSIDPKTLAPELQDVYHNLNKGFTQGMQKKSEEIRQLQAKIAELEQGT